MLTRWWPRNRDDDPMTQRIDKLVSRTEDVVAQFQELHESQSRNHNVFTRQAWSLMADIAGWTGRLRVGALGGSGGITELIDLHTDEYVFTIRAIMDPATGKPRLSIEQKRRETS